MRIGRTLFVTTLCTLASLCVPARSHALFHISVIDEVLASLDGDAEQQFIEIQMLFGSQNLVSNAVVAAFDANGAYVEDILVIPEDVRTARTARAGSSPRARSRPRSRSPRTSPCRRRSRSVAA